MFLNELRPRLVVTEAGSYWKYLAWIESGTVDLMF